MEKIGIDFVIRQYQSGIESYKDSTLNLGLWESEKYVFEKYLRKTFSILDVGCGTGRTTFALYKTGFTNIIGVDLTPEMIAEAQEINSNLGLKIFFLENDATALVFEDEKFDAVVFSFNGVMSIPDPGQRLLAFLEIHRVLKPNGIFIFTTHDRDKDEAYLQFWIDEKKKWEEGEQRTDLYEFGDIITTSKNETGEIFIHIPNQEEVANILNECGFELLETFYRSEKFDETEKVKQKSGECRFWVVKKTSHAI